MPPFCGKAVALFSILLLLPKSGGHWRGRRQETVLRKCREVFIELGREACTTSRSCRDSKQHVHLQVPGRAETRVFASSSHKCQEVSETEPLRHVLAIGPCRQVSYNTLQSYMTSWVELVALCPEHSPR